MTADALGKLSDELQACASTVVGLENLMLELIGRAGAHKDTTVIERAQAMDALAQQLARMAKVAEELAASGFGQTAPLRESFAALARVTPSAASAGDLDLL